MPPVQVIGLGMSPADLSPSMLALIQQADVLAGGRRHLAYFPDFAGRKIVLGKNLAEALADIAAAAAEQHVVVLASGDPNFYGIGPKLTALLGPQRVIIHPNITAVQMASAILGLAWEDAAVVSLHGRDLTPLRQVLGRREKIFIYTGSGAEPAAIARLLLELEWPDYRFCVLENLGQSAQRVLWLSPAEAAAREFAPLNLVVLLADSRPASRLCLGLPEEALAHEAGLITKSEIRAVVLAKLRLQPEEILWDIGAGSGAVGLEAALLQPDMLVYAVERVPARAAQIRANRSKLRVANLEVIAGEAPTCLADLPAPHRVFIGGGGAQLPAILTEVRRRLQPGGRVVLTATLLATLTAATNLLAAWNWASEICQLQVSVSRPLAGSCYLQARNPVWIVSAAAQEEKI